jgi:glycosyltransferase involved in cell wall biosynthesis
MSFYISVVIPLYNKEQSIYKTVSSVIDQTFGDFELLVVDDGSTDKSLEIVKSIDDSRIKIICQNNSGVSSARNTGIINSKGKYVFLLDADDEITPDCFQFFHDLTIKYNGIMVFVSNFGIKSIADSIVPYCLEKSEKSISSPLKYLWLGKVFPRTGTLLINRDCFTQVGFFNSDISLFEDLEFIIRLLRKYTIVFTPRILMLYVAEFNSLSQKILPLHKELAFYSEFTNKSFYERMILAENIYLSYLLRKKNNDVESCSILVEKYKKFFFLFLFAIIIRKLWKEFNRLNDKFHDLFN